LKRIIWIICVGVFSLNAFAQERTLTDSLKHAIQNSPKGKKSALWIQLAHQSATSNTDSTLFFLNQAVQAAQSAEMKGKAYFEKAMFYRYLRKDTEQFRNLDTAYNLLTGVNDSIAGNALHYKQMLLADKGQYKEALQIGYQQLELRKKLPSRNWELNAILQIGYTYDRMGEYHKAIE